MAWKYATPCLKNGCVFLDNTGTLCSAPKRRSPVRSMQWKLPFCLSCTVGWQPTGTVPRAYDAPSQLTGAVIGDRDVEMKVSARIKRRRHIPARWLTVVTEIRKRSVCVDFPGNPTTRYRRDLSLCFGTLSVTTSAAATFFLSVWSTDRGNAPRWRLGSSCYSDHSVNRTDASQRVALHTFQRCLACPCRPCPLLP